MRLTWRDGVAAVFAGLIVLIVLAVTGSWGWPLLGSYRAGIVALVLLAVPMCVIGGLVVETQVWLVALAALIGTKWLIATARHAVETSPRVHPRAAAVH